MSRQIARRSSGPNPGILSRTRSQLGSIPEAPLQNRRPSISGISPIVLSNQKAQRTSKTSQKLVVLPSAPQTKPLPSEQQVDLPETHDTAAREYKSEGERMSKSQRHRAGYKRLTAYCVAESFKIKLLTSFLKREHNVTPRVFDDAVYVVYHLPLLPGYASTVNVRSSVAAKSAGGKTLLARMSEAEEYGYEGTYFTSEGDEESFSLRDGFIPSSSPPDGRKQHAEGNGRRSENMPQAKAREEDRVADVVFFGYGVVVFFGLDEGQERAVLEDLESAGIFVRMFDEDSWEVEECHFVHDPMVAYPRIYNDLFTLKTYSHLLKLSISHALAQSTLLAHYESTAQIVLSDSRTVSIPRQLALTGKLKLRRGEALRYTGRLFKLRRDINLVSNVLDVPELFWSEASLKDLYDAVREYMEISPRVQVLNERLAVAQDLLDGIHDHLNNNAMERITWIIIWLIVVACLVEFGEILARLVVHETSGSASSLPALSRDDALRILEGMMKQAH